MRSLLHHRSQSLGLAATGAVAGALIIWLYSDSIVVPRWLLILEVLGCATAAAFSVLRDRHSRVTVLVIVFCCAVSPPAAPALWIGLYILGARGEYRLLSDGLIGGIGTAFVSAGLFLAQNASDTHVLLVLVILSIALSGASALAGLAMGSARARYEAELRETVAREWNAATLQRLDERAQLSRELHDLLGHRLALLNIFSSALMTGREELPMTSQGHLKIIRTNVQEAALELNQLLRVMGHMSEPDDHEPISEDLGQLFERFRLAGMTLNVENNMNLDGATPSYIRTIERFCREGLTNAIKHAAPGPVGVTMTGDTSDGLDAVIRSPFDDQARTSSTDASDSGMGLLGLRERAAILGGVVWTTVTRNHLYLHLSLPGADAATRTPTAAENE